MHCFLDFLLLAAGGAWVGAILFQSAIVAPSVFGVLDDAAARGFLRTLFPRFFRFGMICAGLCLLAALVAGFSRDWQQADMITAALSAAMAASPTAVVTCRKGVSRTSPAANMPGCEVRILESVTMNPPSSSMRSPRNSVFGS